MSKPKPKPQPDAPVNEQAAINKAAAVALAKPAAKAPAKKAPAKPAAKAAAKPAGSRREVKAMKKAVHSSLKSTAPAKTAPVSKLSELNSTFDALYKPPR